MQASGVPAFLKQLSFNLGGSQLMMSAVATTVEDLKTPSEAGYKGEGRRRDAELAGMLPIKAAPSPPPPHDAALTGQAREVERSQTRLSDLELHGKRLGVIHHP